MLPSMSHPQHSRTIRIGGRSDFVPKLGLVILTSEPGDIVAYLCYVVTTIKGLAGPELGLIGMVR